MVRCFIFVSSQCCTIDSQGVCRFINLWFNAPHGPWEPLTSGEEVYSAKYNVPITHWKKFTCTKEQVRPLYGQQWYYKTMVTAMDKSIGRVLDALRDLGLEENTLVVFTSDNGHEMGAGSAGIYREGKRSLMVRADTTPIPCKYL